MAKYAESVCGGGLIVYEGMGWLSEMQTRNIVPHYPSASASKADYVTYEKSDGTNTYTVRIDFVWSGDSITSMTRTVTSNGSTIFADGGISNG